MNNTVAETQTQVKTLPFDFSSIYYFVDDGYDRCIVSHSGQRADVDAHTIGLIVAAVECDDNLNLARHEFSNRVEIDRAVQPSTEEERAATRERYAAYLASRPYVQPQRRNPLTGRFVGGNRGGR